MACDFCNGAAVAWRYEAHDVAVPVTSRVLVYSAGAWEACEACHGFIERRAWEALADAVAARYVAAHPEEEPASAHRRARAACLAMWARFRAAQFGCRRLTEETYG